MPGTSQERYSPEAAPLTGPAPVARTNPMTAESAGAEQRRCGGDTGHLPAGGEAAEGPRSVRNRLRAALASGDFVAARRLWAEYSDGVRNEIESGTATPATVDEMRDLVEWSRLVVLSFRAHAADRLNQDHAARAYR